MAHLTESDILAALNRYRAYVKEVNHRAMLRMIPAIEAARIEDPVIAEEENEEELRMEYLDHILNIPDNVQPPVKRPSDVLEHWDLLAPHLGLDGTSVDPDLEWRATKRNTYRSAILEGLGRLECPTGQWAFPPDLEMLMQHVDSLEGHGWWQLRDWGGFVFWKGWGPKAPNETHEWTQQRVVSGQTITDSLSIYDRDKYDIAAAWECGGGNESCVYVFYSRAAGDDSQSWSWRYMANLGQWGIEFFDDIVAVLDWLKERGEPDEQDMEIDAEVVFAP